MVKVKIVDKNNGDCDIFNVYHMVKLLEAPRSAINFS